MKTCTYICTSFHGEQYAYVMMYLVKWLFVQDTNDADLTIKYNQQTNLSDKQLSRQCLSKPIKSFRQIVLVVVVVVELAVVLVGTPL